MFLTARVWYDDQRGVHRQIFEGDETMDYAFMDGAGNQWIRDAFENRMLKSPVDVPLAAFGEAS